MAFAITNRVINVAPDWTSVSKSTDFQFVSTATSTSVNVGAGSRYFEYADYTTTGPIPLATQVSTGTIGDHGSEYKNYRALIYFKQYAPSTATATSTAAVATPALPVVALEVATSTGYSPVYVIDWRNVPPASTAVGSTGSGGPSLTLWGTVPITAGARFARINFYGRDSATAVALSCSTALDAIIEAV